MHTKVETIMTTEVVTVSERTPFKEIVNELRLHGVNAVPVLRADETVSGIVSATDLMLKEADPSAAEDPHPFAGPHRRRELRKTAGTTAGDLMTAPAVTTSPDATVEEAARLMWRKHVSRLPVVDTGTGRLVGLVSRADVLRVYSRPDEQIRQDVLDEAVTGRFGLETKRCTVAVTEGRVTVQGMVDRRSIIPVLLHGIRRVEGVVSADAQLGWEVDDTYAGRYPTL
jgi:CBS-domain-containing membrane protein